MGFSPKFDTCILVKNHDMIYENEKVYPIQINIRFIGQFLICLPSYKNLTPSLQKST